LLFPLPRQNFVCFHDSAERREPRRILNRTDVPPIVDGSSGLDPDRPDAAALAEELRRHTTHGRIVRHAGLGLAQQAISIGVGILLLPFLIGRLGAERYGLLLILQLISIAGVLAYADAGLPGGVSRSLTDFYARGDVAGFRRLLHTELLTFLGIGVGCALLVLAFGRLLFFRVFSVPLPYQPELRTGILLYAGSFVVYFFGLGVKAFFSGVNDLTRLRLWETMERVTAALAMAGAVLFRPAILSVVIGEQTAILTVMIVFTFTAARAYPTLFAPHRSRFSGESLRQVVPLSGYAFLNRLTWFAYQKAPDLLIGSVLGARAMTGYVVIAKIPRALKTLGSALNGAVFPAASAMESLDMPDRVAALVLRGTRYGYLIVTPLILFLMIFARQILTLWVGAEFAGLANLLRAYLVWQYAMFVVFFLTASMTTAAQYRRLLPFGLVANVVFFAITLPTLRSLGLWSILLGLLGSGAITVAGPLHVQAVHGRMTYSGLLREVIVPVIGVSVLTAVSLFGLQTFASPSRWIGLTLALCAAFAIHLALSYGIVLGRDERVRFKALILRSRPA
jgi:membrane protein EpsK